MGHTDAGHRRGRDTGERELALGALTRIEEDRLAVPAEQIPVVVAVMRRRLTRRSQHDEFTFAHSTGLSHCLQSHCLQLMDVSLQLTSTVVQIFAKDVYRSGRACVWSWIAC